MRSRWTWLAPAAVAAGMAKFALDLHFEVCSECSEALAPWMVAGAGVAWAAVFWFASSGSSRTAYGLALLAVAGHGGLIASLPSEACTSCWAFLAGEIGSVAALGVASGVWSRLRWRIAAATLLAGGLALAGSATAVEAAFPSGLSRVLGGRQDADLRVLVFVKKSCGACRQAIDETTRALEEGADELMRVELVEVTTEEGRQLFQRYEVRGWPSFLALRGEERVHSQHRGTLVEFFHALGIVKENGRWVRRRVARAP